MKKLFGLMAIVSLAACTSDDSSSALNAAQNWANENTLSSAADVAPVSSDATVVPTSSDATVVPVSSAAASPTDGMTLDPATGLYYSPITGYNYRLVGTTLYETITGFIYDPTTNTYTEPSTGIIWGPEAVATKISLMLQSSSSAGALVASSSAVVTPVVSSSSTVTPAVSSSSKAVVASSSATATGVAFELWDGSDAQVQTGNAKAGYWYFYDDSEDSNGAGASTFTWGGTVGDEYSETSLAPVVAACGGLCGEYDLVVGDNPYKPYVGFGFNVNATATATADATVNQTGICVEYTFVPSGSSTMAIELGLGSKDATIGYANPFVELPAASTPTVKDFAWSAFTQASWATTKITGANAAKTLAAIKFKIAGETDAADGGTGSFTITKFGPKGSCN